MTRCLSCRHCVVHLAAIAVLAVSDFGSGPVWGQGTGPAADFSLPDVNPNSALFETNVSPRDYLGQVSGWYFGHGT